VHELSVAHALVDTVVASLREADEDAAVREVHLRVGVVAGVVPQSLLFCYDLVTESTPLAGSRLVIETAPIRGHCPGCNQPREAFSLAELSCIACTSPLVDVAGGGELELSHLVLDDGPVEPGLDRARAEPATAGLGVGA
jgi:hydrogenase nickel incorporation protein HypA/HybF